MLTLTEHTDGSTRILRLSGDLCSAGVARLRARLTAAVAAPTHDITADLSNVNRIDGSGIGALAFLHRRLAAAGRKLSVAGACGQPRDCLQDLGLVRLLAA
ncbi:MAG: STAS domain-containing protein [Alphaproteobacteria bacterium]|nr:STAS domain-containing protein [Alphaproteobacteria bacterium]